MANSPMFLESKPIPLSLTHNTQVNGLRVSINEVCNRQRSRVILVGDLIDHYQQTELCDKSEWYPISRSGNKS
jgi:hypothetical protein